MEISIWLVTFRQTAQSLEIRQVQIFIWRVTFRQTTKLPNPQIQNLKIWNTYFPSVRPGRPQTSSRAGESLSMKKLLSCRHLRDLISAIFE